MCLLITAGDICALKKNRAHLEGGVYRKLFKRAEQATWEVQPLAHVWERDAIQEIEAVHKIETVLFTREPGVQYHEGKVYFDNSKVWLSPEPYEELNHSARRYLTGYHAAFQSIGVSLLAYMGEQVERHVMLAEITAANRDAVVGRIMLVMTDADYIQFYQDSTTKPIKIKGETIEVLL